MLKIFLKGGPLMWPICVCSVISITIVLERFYHLHKVKLDIPGFFSQIKGFLKKGEWNEAVKLCEISPSPAAKVLSAAIKNYRRHLQLQEKVISRVGSHEVRNLEKHLRGLAVIGNIAPLLGLLGTVTGMIQAFIKIQELGGRVDASVLAGGIWEALITTAAGLSVAIPTLVAYHYFEGRVDNIASQMKEVASEFLESFGVKPTVAQDEVIKEDECYGI